MTTRTPSTSATETTHVILPSDTNSRGTAFGGKIMQWMDIAAAIAAGRHCHRPVVTAAVDELYFAHPIRMGDVVILRARVNFTGRTSMEVGVRVDREDLLHGVSQHCLSGYFTFVALDDDGRPAPVPPLQLETDLDRTRHQAAAKRRAHRLKMRKGGS